jgi:primase-polymerase (primpol)-like protein
MRADRPNDRISQQLPPSDGLSIGALRELAEHDQFVAWKPVIGADGKLKKIPINPVTGKIDPKTGKIDPKTARNASVSDPNTWGTHQQACDHDARNEEANGVGFVLSGIDGYTVVDLDSPKDKDGNLIPGEEIVNPDTGEVKQWARKLVADFNTYCETSPSGTGLHLWLRGRPPGGRCRTKGIEIYSRKRFITVTGAWRSDLVETDEIEERQERLDKLYDRTFGGGNGDGRAIGNGSVLPLARPDGEEGEEGEPLPASRHWSFEAAQPYVERAMGKTFNQARWTALYANERRFKRIWNRTDARLKEKCGDDDSEWDLALANLLLDANYNWIDTVGILIAYRKQYSPDKLERADYWARTISKASNRVAQRQERQQEKAEEEEIAQKIDAVKEKHGGVEVRGDITNDRDQDHDNAILRDACEILECPEILKITCAKKKTSSIYSIYFGDQEADIVEGDVSLLIGQAKFRHAIADKFRVIPRPLSANKWREVSGWLLRAVQNEEIFITEVGETIEWVQGYLANQPRPLKFSKETYLTDGPWRRKDGHLIIKLATFSTYLRRYHRMTMSGIAIARRLREIGVVMDRINYHVGGRKTSKPVYVVPDENNFYALADNEPQDIEFDEE